MTVKAWTGNEIAESGRFVRQENRFALPFGEKAGEIPVEANRYRLLWSPVCPWAHRSVIVRSLLGLDQVISLGTADPVRPDKKQSDWAFTLDENEEDPVLKIKYVSDVYLNADPEYNGRFTVPVVVDIKTKKAANNDYYARDLYQTPGFGDTTDFDAIKKHYHLCAVSGNPNKLLPKGPDQSIWNLPHNREKLSKDPNNKFLRGE